MEKREKGITLIALAITIIVLLILASITISGGTDAIKRANLESLKTNMLLVQTKAREYVENASFKLGVNPTEEKEVEARQELKEGTVVNSGNAIESELISFGISEDDINSGNVYQLTTEDLESMGIKDVDSDDENGWYIIVYDIDNVSAEIYHTVGYEDKHSLTDIEQIEL